jgi:hypothetical protein
MTLRDRVHVPTVWMTGWQAAMRRVSEMMTPKASSGGASDAVRIDFDELVRSDPSLLEPLAIPVITPALLDQAVEGLEQKNVLRFLGCANGNEYWLDLLAANVPLLKELDLYERGLLDALIASRTNNYVHRDKIPLLIEHADRAKLLAAGDPLPGPGPFLLYRGVAGRGSARRVRGLSWTASLDRARFFARRYPELHDPAVFRVTVSAEHVLAYTNERKEEEFLVILPKRTRPVLHERVRA